MSILKKVTVHSVHHRGHADVQLFAIELHPRCSVNLQGISAIAAKVGLITSAGVVYIASVWSNNSIVNKVSLQSAARVRAIVRGVEGIVSNEVIKISSIIDAGRWVGLAC